MRKLRIVVRTARGTLPLLVAASVLPAAACSGRQASDSGGTSTSTSGGTSSTEGSAEGSSTETSETSETSDTSDTETSGTTGVKFDVGGSNFDVGMMNDVCEEHLQEQEYVIELPPPGTPPDPGQICPLLVDPVESNQSAFVRLVRGGGDIQTADGQIDLDPAIDPLIMSDPTIEVIDASEPGLANMEISNLVRVMGGFTFVATWPDPLFVMPDGLSRLTVRVGLELPCPDDETKTVHALTHVHLCMSEEDGAEWMSSGDNCVVCRDIFVPEMAPSPIVPDVNEDPLPLADMMRLRLVEVARVSNTIVLLAENDGGEQVDYRWQASKGKIEELAPDVVAWTVGEGEEASIIQAAALGPSSVSVASFTRGVAA